MNGPAHIFQALFYRTKNLGVVGHVNFSYAVKCKFLITKSIENKFIICRIMKGKIIYLAGHMHSGQEAFDLVLDKIKFNFGLVFVSFANDNCD